jgi:hypothetical protein
LLPMRSPTAIMVTDTHNLKAGHLFTDKAFGCVLWESE